MISTRWVTLGALLLLACEPAPEAGGATDAGVDEGTPAQCRSERPCDFTGTWHLTNLAGATQACDLPPDSDTLRVTIDGDAVSTGFGRGRREATLDANGCHLAVSSEDTWEDGGEPQSDLRRLELTVDGDVARGTLHHEAWWTCQDGGDFAVLALRDGAEVPPECAALPPAPGCARVPRGDCDWPGDPIRLAYAYDPPLEATCGAPTAEHAEIWRNGEALCARVGRWPVADLAAANGGCDLTLEIAPPDADPPVRRTVRLSRRGGEWSGDIESTAPACAPSGTVERVTSEGEYTYGNWEGAIEDDAAALTAAGGDPLFTLRLDSISPGRRPVDLLVRVADPDVMRDVPCAHDDANGDGLLDAGETLRCVEPAENRFGPEQAGQSLAVFVFERVGDLPPTRLTLSWAAR